MFCKTLAKILANLVFLSGLTFHMKLYTSNHVCTDFGAVARIATPIYPTNIFVRMMVTLLVLLAVYSMTIG